MNDFQQNEPQLFRFWSTLTIAQQALLQQQLAQISFSALDEQKRSLTYPTSSFSFDSFEDFALIGNTQDEKQGQKFIEQGAVGCLLLAGGEGTRLRFQGPKGCYPISVIKQKSLFQIFAEKVVAASQLAETLLPLAIMLSPENQQATQEFFRYHKNFGLDASQLYFFVQQTLPFLDKEAKLFLEKPWKVANGPNGNGNSLLYFFQSGIGQKWKEQGVQFLQTVLIDNPLANPFDAEFVGFHIRQQADVSLKAVEKTQPNEKVGVLVKKETGCTIIEYSELSEKEKHSKKSNGQLKHCCANSGLFCFSFTFIDQMIREQQSLPLHKAWKPSSYVDEQGNSHFSNEPMAWKFETFIFDWLEKAARISVLLYPREKCFAPLKNFSGEDSPEIVRNALQAADRRAIEKLTALPAPTYPFELAPQFHYPTPSLQSAWKGRLPVNAYITN